jgi:hypothetical protein
MIDKQKLISQMKKMADLRCESNVELLILTRRHFTMLFHELIHTNKYDVDQKEDKNV